MCIVSHTCVLCHTSPVSASKKLFKQFIHSMPQFLVTGLQHILYDTQAPDHSRIARFDRYRVLEVNPGISVLVKFYRSLSASEQPLDVVCVNIQTPRTVEPDRRKVLALELARCQIQVTLTPKKNTDTIKKQ